MSAIHIPTKTKNVQGTLSLKQAQQPNEPKAPEMINDMEEKFSLKWSATQILTISSLPFLTAQTGFNFISKY